MQKRNVPYLPLTFIIMMLVTFQASHVMAQSGGSGTKSDPYIIATDADLTWLAGNSGVWGSYFMQTADVSATGVSNPIGNSTDRFTGGYNGLGHTIIGLSLSTTAGNQGLFGVTNGAEIKNLRVTGASITGGSGVGVLIGRADGPTIVSNVFVSGTVTSTATGASDAGGLVGYAVNITVSNSGADVVVSAAGRNVGGFVGDARIGTYNNCYSIGDVTATSATEGNAGGFAGFCRTNEINNSWARGNVSQAGSTTSQGVGGFIGLLDNSASNTPEINNSYSTGTATGGSNQGGFIGLLNPTGVTLNNNFFNTTTSGIALAIGSGTASGTNPITGITTASMQTKTTFTTPGWDFNTDWFITGTQNDGFPISQWAAEPDGTITIVTGASDSQENWTLNNGVLKPLQSNPNVSVSDIIGVFTSPATVWDADNLNIIAPVDILIDADIAPGAAVNQSFYMKAGRDIVLRETHAINMGSNTINVVFWSDTDGNEAGGVLFDLTSSVSTTDGHVWIGGGDGSSTWNGLTVGDSYAVGLTNTATGSAETYAGINAVGSSVNAGQGDIYLSGKSTQTTYRFGIGTRINGMDFTGNNITMFGIGSTNVSTADDTNRGNWGIGVENTDILASREIILEGTGGGQSAGSNGGQNYGIRMDNNSTIITTGASNITLTGTGGGNPANTLNTDNDGLRIDGGTIRVNTGTITLTGTKGLHGSSVDLDHTRGVVESRDPSTSNLSNGSIQLIVDEMWLNPFTSPSTSPAFYRTDLGQLTIRPRTPGTTIGISGPASTLNITSLNWTTNFVNGFANIIIGSSDAGQIEIAGSTTYNDNLTIKTAADIIVNPISAITGRLGENASLILWADADGDDSGMIWVRRSHTINTNGGHLWMGGGAGTATWNGLTVGDSYAAGSVAFIPEDNELSNQNGYHGITLDEDVTITTGVGNIQLNGISGDEFAPTLESNPYSTNVGVYLGDGSQTSTTSGSIEINGVARLTADQPASGCTTCGFRYGILFHRASETSARQILVTTQSGNIVLNGVAQDYTGATTDRMNSGGVTLFAGDQGMVVSTDSGNIEITGENQETTAPTGRTARGVWLTTGQTDITSTSGSITVEAKLGITSTQALALQADTKIGDDTSGDLEIRSNGWTGLTSTTVISGTGELRILPTTASTTIGLGGASGTLSLPASYFTDSFADGFSNIILGSATQTGNIEANTFTIQDNMTFLSTGNLTLGGNLDLNGQTVTLGEDITLVESGGRFFGTSGELTTTRTLGTLSAENVGGMGATLTTTTALGATTITRTHGAQTKGSDNSILRSYSITPATNTGLDATLVFNYVDAELNSLPESTLALHRSTDGGTNWSNEGGTVDDTGNTVTLNGIDAFSLWTLFTGTFVWSGTTDTESGTGSNWAGSTVPPAGSDIRIPTGLTNYPVVAGNFEAGDLDIETGATFTMAPGFTLTFAAGKGASGDGKIILKSDATGDASIGDLTAAGTVGVEVVQERYVAGNNRAFRFMSHPFSAAMPLSAVAATIDITGDGGATNGFTTTDTNNPSAFRFDPTVADGASGEDAGWVPFTNTSQTIGVAEAIRILVRGSKGQSGSLLDGAYTPEPVTFEFEGTINTGNVVKTLSAATVGLALSDWNLVGNPYPSPINLQLLITGSADNDAYVWDPRAAYTGSESLISGAGRGGAYVTEPITGTGSYILPAGSGFFIKALADGNTITFAESMKVAGDTPANFESVLREENATSKYGPNTVQIRLEHEDVFYDRFILRFRETTAAYNEPEDGAKFANPVVNFFPMSEDGYALAIDDRPYTEEEGASIIPVWIMSPPNEYTLSVPDFDLEAGRSLTLYDRFTEETISLSKGQSYSFEVTSDPKSRDHRFDLIMGGEVVTSLQNLQNELQVILMPNPAEQQVAITFQRRDELSPAEIRIVDMQGLTLHRTTVQPEEEARIDYPVNSLRKGVYLVEVRQGGVRQVKKLVVR